MVSLLIAATIQAAQPVWIDLPRPRHGHRSHVLGGKLYVFGGFERHVSPSTNSLLAGDLRTGRWEPLAPMIKARAFFASASVENAIFAIGSSSIEKYDPQSNRWRLVNEGEVLPNSHCEAASVGNLIYILGKDFLSFDTKTNLLSRLPGYPGMKPGDHFELVGNLRSRVHVVGGLDGDTFEARSTHFVFDGKSWSQEPDAPFPMFGKFAVGVVHEGKFYCLTPDGSAVYDPGSKTWKRLAKMPETVAMPTALVRNGWIVLIGGQPNEGYKVRLAYDLARDKWVKG